MLATANKFKVNKVHLLNKDVQENACWRSR